MKRHYTILLIAVLIFAGVGSASASNPNPGVIPNDGGRYGELSAKWWQWAYSYSIADVPFLNTGGTVDISSGQSGHTWFLAGQAPGSPVVRSGVVPAKTYLFFPLANFVNDYPCVDDPTFQPAQGESLMHFLQRTANAILDYYLGNPPTTLFAEIDGVSLTDLASYRATSNLFYFTADPALYPSVDTCVTGTRQPGIAVGYWLLLAPLTPGQHTLHFGTPGLGQDITYDLTVTP